MGAVFAPRRRRETVAEERGGAAQPVVIKKYANRRLYNTQSSTYVTLDHLAKMVKDGAEFVVHDARTGEDITRSVLTQIIFEEEAKGESLLPITFLRQLIRFYGDSMQAFVPGYLDMSLESLSKNQEAMKSRVAEALGGGNQALENLTRQNLDMFERTMKMFSPFGAMPGAGATAARPEPKTERSAGTAATRPAPPDSKPERAEDITELKNEMDALRRQLQELARDRK
jgi:polyhydroxyalkanoate synthesis repressor PhaR